MTSTIDQIILWYGQLPSAMQTVVTVVVGAAVAYVAFRIVIRLIAGIVGGIVAAALAFLLTTLPGNMLMSQAYDRIEQQVSSSLSQR